ncbi:MAG: ABC transporter permease [Bacilli bacterium]
MKSNKRYLFIIILSVIISFFSSIAINVSNIEAEIQHIDYSNYPRGYSTYKLLDTDDYKDFMEYHFPNFEYKSYFTSSNDPTTNLRFENLKVNVIGCEANFETFPLPSCYSESINFSSLKYGTSFEYSDIITKTNALIMYESHIQKIGLKDDQYIEINGTPFFIKGVLSDNNDVLRNIDKNIIQMFIPHSTFSSLFKDISVNTIIYTQNTNFTLFDNEINFMSEFKVNNLIETSYNYFVSSSMVSLVMLFGISFISIVIVQTILIRERYNEIGIRRAVGASKSDIIYLFSKSSLLSSLVGAIIGFVIYLIVFSFIALILSLKYFTNLFLFNINMVLIFLSIYLIVCFLSILISTIIGTRINIATILVEER